MSIRYTQSGGVGGIWATNYLQAATGWVGPSGEVYMAEDRDASLTGGSTSLADHDSGAFTAGVWELVDLSHIVAPWSRFGTVAVNSIDDDATDQLVLQVRPHRSTAGLDDSRGQVVRLAADLGADDLRYGATIDLPWVGGRFFVRCVSGTEPDYTSWRVMAYR